MNGGYKDKDGKLLSFDGKAVLDVLPGCWLHARTTQQMLTQVRQKRFAGCLGTAAVMPLHCCRLLFHGVLSAMLRVLQKGRPPWMYCRIETNRLFAACFTVGLGFRRRISRGAAWRFEMRALRVPFFHVVNGCVRSRSRLKMPCRIPMCRAAGSGHGLALECGLAALFSFTAGVEQLYF
ncbi:MAG: hypothetical protein LBI68_07175 [Azoarcus sp.]|jgi:hypothetical protein|nr:hypothetical protein [Azoarcus sp.]